MLVSLGLVVGDMPRRAFIASIIKVSGNVNADISVGIRVPMKKIFNWKQEVKAFVSARCIRRCIRERLAEKEGLYIDPLQLVGAGRERQLGDIGNPIKYIDDDLFGFLVPERQPRKRSSPVKISPLISLHHTEIKVEFAARFPRDFLKDYQEGNPVPFEIEVAEWLGRLNVIVSDRIGRFEVSELTEDMWKSDKVSEVERGVFQLSAKERKRRLRALLEVLLWEGWEFPRGSESPCTPEFYYAVVALTEHFTPIFSYVDVSDDELDESKLARISDIYGKLINRMYVIDYRQGVLDVYERGSEGTLVKVKSDKLNSETIREVIEGVCEYIVA
ncbi:MAG: type I-B CRISPR-associated protein Cas7/Cst2/DevR [Thermoprotei archaeon]|nr:MAG: type I-B CRISPR-associated protein Cas7/Cst2/DevR [Thermoprotei archaeon]